MGLFDITTNVLTRYKADTTDQKRKMKDLSREQQKLAQKQIASLEKQNKKIDSQIAMWGKVAGGVAAAGVAVLALKKGYDELNKVQNLQNEAQRISGFSLERLRKSSQGLLTDMQLLALASDAQNSTFGATQTQLENLTRLIIGYRKENVPLERAITNVTKAFVEANARPLIEFGDNLGTTRGQVESITAMMDLAGKKTEKFAGNFSMAGDEVVLAAINGKNAWSEFQQSLGQIMKAMMPAISDMTRKIADLAQTYAGFYAFVRDTGGYQVAPDELARMFRGKTLTPEERKRAWLKARGAEGTLTGIAAKEASRLGIEIKTPKKTKGGSGRGGGGLGGILDGGYGEGSAWSPSMASSLGVDIMGGLTDLDQFATKAPELSQNLDLMTESLVLGASAWGTFQGSATQAFTAIILGTESMGTALKRLAGDMIIGISQQMFAKALFHTAAGVGALAFPDPLSKVSASQHFKAAALFGAGAVATGTMARVLGVGGSGSSGGAAGGGSTSLAPSVPGSGSGVGSSVTVIVSDDWEQDSQRRRAARMRGALVEADKALGRGEKTVVYR